MQSGAISCLFCSIWHFHIYNKSKGIDEDKIHLEVRNAEV